MFGMGGTEILVILIVALLFLGPDKLPEAAKQISKGIRDIKKQSRVLQRTIEDDEHIGGAIRDLKSALRGEDEPIRPRPLKPAKQLVDPATQTAGTLGAPEAVATIAAAAATALPEPGAPEHGAGPEAPAGSPPDEAAALTMPPTAGEPDEAVPAASSASDDAELAAMVKPAANTIPRESSQGRESSHESPSSPAVSDPSESKHG